MYFMKSVSRNSTCYFSDIKVNGNKRYWLPCCKYLVQVNQIESLCIWYLSWQDRDQEMSLLDKDSDTGLVDPLHGQEEEEWWDTRGQRAVIRETTQNNKQLKLTDHLYKAVPLLTDVSVIKCVFKLTLYTCYVLFVWDFWHSINKLLNKTLCCCWQVYYHKFIRRPHHRL